MEGLPTTGPITKKHYRSLCCGATYEAETNHWGSIYNTKCGVCGNLSEFECLMQCPPGYDLPKKWSADNPIDPAYGAYLLEYLRGQGFPEEAIKEIEDKIEKAKGEEDVSQ